MLKLDVVFIPFTISGGIKKLMPEMMTRIKVGKKDLSR